MLKTLDIELNDFERLLFHKNEYIKLTPNEYKLLIFLLKNPNRPIKRDEIENLIWKNLSVSKNTLDTHLYNLKKKIPILDQKINSLYGNGFLFKI